MVLLPEFLSADREFLKSPNVSQIEVINCK